MSKIVVVRNVLEESAVEEADLKPISREVQGQVVEVGEVTWSLWDTGTVWALMQMEAVASRCVI